MNIKCIRQTNIMDCWFACTMMVLHYFRKIGDESYENLAHLCGNTEEMNILSCSC